MSSCTECGTELEPLDTICSKCGSVRDDNESNESAAGGPVVDRSPATTELGESSAVETAPLQTDTRQIRLLLIVVLGFFALINLVMYPLIEHSRGNRENFLASLWAGTIMAQFALVSAWWVFAPLSLFQRSLWGVVAGTLWFGAFAVGFVVAGYESSLEFPYSLTLHVSEELMFLVSTLPSYLLTAQAPLWCARFWFRWRVQGPDVTANLAANRPVEHRPLRILDVMIATAVVAVALAVAKLGNQGGFFSDTAYLGVLLIFTVVVAGVAALSLLPCLGVGLRRPMIEGGVATLVLIHVAYIFAVLKTLRSDSPSDWGVAFLAIGTYFTIVMVVLRVSRRCGYTLRWKNE